MGKFFLIGLSLLITGISASCAMPNDNGTNREKVMVSAKDIDEALAKHSGELLAVPGVEGAARGDCQGSPCLKVYVSSESPELQERLADILEGLPVVIEKSGSFQAY
jgi:hypothetical protein